MSAANLWLGVPFHAGDTVLLEWTEDAQKTGRAVWLVPASYTVEDPDFAELSDENEEMGGLGLTIHGSENVHPTKLTVLEPGAVSPIPFRGYRKVDFEDLEEGDSVIIAVRGHETLVAEHTLNELSFEGHADGQLYDFLDITFFDDDETVFFRKAAS